MLSKAKEKLIKSLHTKKGREKQGLCLVEGSKVIELAGNAVDFTFKRSEVSNFDEFVSTETPQDIAGTARIPNWTKGKIQSRKNVVVLDGVQDPGNVGAILRLCLGFNASLLLIESADITSPKVVRSSVGAIFQVPWMKLERKKAVDFISKLERKVIRLEVRDDSVALSSIDDSPAVIIAGSEGSGISLDIDGQSVAIEHSSSLESLNVGHALAIVLNHKK